ncbi:50S ribosomal protein L4 [Posidoniimonas polymericola]|uniref:Large ribosomal subunit protein uL4 n=1 Tax=Posidoniimonas polymericola TaxID=2528002 RepID=A0A5C5YD73_9BACT|nr:50S ribosomal protein L4 [Posidoniimonas polymericola]TWT73656.1 50S ribosomal protein L4 [Posidoniimonas polymericola]
MPKLTVHDRKGNKVGTLNLEVEDFAPSINKQLLHDAVVMYQANLRQGSHQTKSRADVSGTTKKLYRQKGTGNARAGSRRSGVRRGGGHIFAIKPRDYSYRLPKKALRLATRMALASKVQDDELIIIDDLKFDAPKTKDMAQVIKNLGCDGGSLLVTTAEHDANVYKSARNIAKVSVSRASDLNALNLLSSRRVLVTKAAIEALKANASSNGKANTTTDGEE